MTTTSFDDQFAPDPAHPAGAPVLYQHDDGRYGLSLGPAQFAVGEPAWHHVPIDVVEQVGGGQTAAADPVQVKTRQTPVGLEIAVWQDGQCVYCDVEPAAGTVPADEREAFEAWARNGFELHRHGGAEYSSHITQCAWAAWQARAALAAPAAPQAGEGVLRIYAEGSMRTLTEWLDGARDLPDGDHVLYATPQPAAQAAPAVMGASRKSTGDAR